MLWRERLATDTFVVSVRPRKSKSLQSLANKSWLSLAL
jgi:hypothetical protein